MVVTQKIGLRQNVKAVIADGRAAALIKGEMNALNVNVIGTLKHPHLHNAVCYHPDMVICPIGMGKMVIEPLMYEYYVRALAAYNVELIKGHRELSRNYPFNIAYNIATVGNKAFLNRRYADEMAVEALKNEAADLIDVKQGYAKCSTAVVDGNSIITSDRSIYAGATLNGVDVLLIEPGHIELKGYDHGFIGGCCGKIKDSLLVFAGDPSTHPDGDRIMKFLKKRGIKVIPLLGGPLIDIGTIIPVLEIS